VSALKFPKSAIFIGDSSYSLYLAHSFAIGALVAMIGAFGIASYLSPWLVFALCVVVSIIAGSLSYLLIEKPLLSVSKRLIFSRKSE
jgi:peptidoglycan/LPS O-acetylase OafA/YrhL